MEEVELRSGDGDARALGRQHLPQGDVEGPAGEVQAAALVGVGRLGGDPAQDRADAGEQLPRVERLGQVIVGAQFQPEDPIDILRLRRQDQDRDLRRIPQAPAQAEPVLPREHQVQHDQIDARFRQRMVHVGSVARERHAAIVAAQIARDQGRDLPIVLHDEDVGCRRYRHRDGVCVRFSLHHGAIMPRTDEYSKVSDETNL